MRSLRARVLLVTLLSIAVTLALVVTLTRQVAHMEFRAFEVTERSIRPAAAAWNAARARDPDPGAALAGPDSARRERAMERLATASGHELLMVGPHGERRAASTPELSAGNMVVEPGGR